MTSASVTGIPSSGFSSETAASFAGRFPRPPPPPRCACAGIVATIVISVAASPIVNALRMVPLRIILVTNIRGGGVAANCCAHLLGRAGVGVVSDQTSINRNDRPKIPALLIGTATQALIEDVFERKDVFRGAQRISKRVVAWGARAGNADPVELPHSA